MEKKISRLLNCLKLEYCVFWFLCVLLVALYETDLLPQGVWVGDFRMEYVFKMIAVLMTVVLIPLSLRVFKSSLVRYVRLLSMEEALKSYRRWSEIRLAMLLAPALFDISVYYWILDTTTLLCGCMVLIASLFCVPGRERLLAELDLNRSSEA